MTDGWWLEPLAWHSSHWPVNMDVSLSHSPTLSLAHSLTLSLSHSLNLSLSHSLTLSLSHSLTLTLSHYLTLSLSHSLTLSPSHSLTVVRCRRSTTCTRRSRPRARREDPRHRPTALFLVSEVPLYTRVCLPSLAIRARRDAKATYPYLWGHRLVYNGTHT